MNLLLGFLHLFFALVFHLLFESSNVLISLLAAACLLLCLRHRLRWSIGGSIAGVLLVILCIRAWAYIGMTTDRDGLATLNRVSPLAFSAREVYVVRGGSGIAKAYRFRLKASPSEVSALVQKSSLREIPYEGGRIDWPHLGVNTYWWRPPHTPTTRVFREHKNKMPRTLVYDQETGMAYYHWWDT